MYQNGALGGIAFGGRWSELKSLLTAVLIFVYTSRPALVAQLDRVLPPKVVPPNYLKILLLT